MINRRYMVLAAARDALVDRRCSGDLARAWDVPLEINSAAGHDLPLDDEAWLLHRIQSCITRAGRDDPSENTHSCHAGATKT
ncbi:MAG: hypothetical protein NDI67_06500 [Sulfuritalea sp.]|nr:hypothetical protein [Sulfuritalea sp.]